MASDIHIKGVQQSSLIDYPEKICSVVFLSKCNFRCPFCHNPELVFDNDDFDDISVEEFMQFLDKKRKWLDAVCITGGEPTLHTGLLDFIRQIKAKGLLIKLDSNGTNPDILQKAIDEQIVDYIAMDIKNSLERYEETTNSKVNIGNIKRSIELIKDAGRLGKIDYEFRTTVLPRLHTQKDFEDIARLLSGSKNYYLQKFVTEEALVDQSFTQEKSYSTKELEHFLKLLLKNTTEQIFSG